MPPRHCALFPAGTTGSASVARLFDQIGLASAALLAVSVAGLGRGPETARYDCPMSREPHGSPASAAPTESSRSARTAGRRFTRLFSVTIAVLVLLVAGLAAANFSQGPRLASAEINLDASVARGNPRLLLTANLPLAEVAAGQVSVSPATEVSTSVNDRALTVEFAGILRYNTVYTVTVTDVAGTSQSATSTLEYKFTTPDIDIYALQRERRLGDSGVKLPDTVRRTTLLGRGDGDVVFSAPRIQQYVALESHLAAVTLGDDDAATLEVVSFAGGDNVQVPLPGAGTIENLRASPSKYLIAYTFTSGPDAQGRRHDRTPFVYDLTEYSGLPVEVTGVDDLPMAVMDLVFVPDSTTLVVQKSELSMFLVDMLGDAVLTPLGQHAELRDFVPGTRALVVADPNEGATIDLADGSVTTLDLAPSLLDRSAYPGKVVLLNEQGRYARLFLQETTGINQLASLIAVTDPDDSSVAFAPASESSSVRDFCVSPNGQYLAVETIPAAGLADEYPTLAAFSGMTTTLVDLDRGTSSRSVSGFLPDWCG
ncbi:MULTISPECIES: Ig-like domain-containing protein [Cryobacterium]|uniref:SbsA Ig-like domain-containing protein n=1 Tax=Cryobacterium breve TaxID=1259258 RepID=A0ABY2IW83_9MICO|nr:MULTISPECIES: Ig-like domain-containing protein [Cryobacterium]TFC93083.1 hypothetical protein E3T20_10685 [Cryobacterium sp. TmT3-12]TFC96068.1 hypothetical protein E3O65_13555 [Cryobacterium breve]